MATASLRVSAQNRRLQIVRVATQLFARQGFQGTTTRQIAERAGINEAIIFRHFPTKEDLYWTIIDENIRAGGCHKRLEERLRSAADDVEVFAELAEKMLRRDTTLTRLLLFSALEKHRLSHRFFRTYMEQYYDALAERIREGIEAGRYRQVDPLLAARSFLGLVFYHFMIQELFGGKRYRQFAPAEVSRSLAEIFIQGMRPPDGVPGSCGIPRAAKSGNHRSESENEPK